MNSIWLERIAKRRSLYKKIIYTSYVVPGWRKSGSYNFNMKKISADSHHIVVEAYDGHALD